LERRARRSIIVIRPDIARIITDQGVTGTALRGTRIRINRS